MAQVKNYLLICLAAFILVFIWFKDGYMMSYAESAFSFYNLERYFSLTSNAWTEYPGLGSVSLVTTASKPTYLVLSKIQQAGISGLLIQAGVFWFLLISSGIGIVLLTKELFEKIPNRYLILGVFFYWFNPLSLVNVWNRFLLNYMFFFGALPIFVFLFIKGLRTKNYQWSLVQTLAFGVYSFSFSYLAFPPLLWITFTLLTILFLIYEYRSSLFFMKYFFLTLILFVLANSWWISQLIALDRTLGFGQGFSQVFNSQANVGTLDALSKSLGNFTDILRLSNSSFTQAYQSFSDSFSPLVQIFEYCFMAIIMITIIKKRKDLFFLLFAGLLLLIIFLSKGSNPPFGEIYRAFFVRFSALQILRNPLEKFSFLLAIFFTPLFIYSLYYISKEHFIRYKNTIFFVFLSFIIIIWGYPFYTGLVFTSNEPPANNPSNGYKIKVPDYYLAADQWLSSRGNNFRYIGLPFQGEGITYRWEKGYSGVELSSALFSTPGILFNTSTPYFFQLVPEIEKFLYDNEEFYKMANILNARYIFVRDDIDFKSRKMKNPKEIKERLNELVQKNQLRQQTSFGSLTFWENLKWNDFSFYPATNLVNSSSSFSISDISFVDPTSGSALTHNFSDQRFRDLVSLDLKHQKQEDVNQNETITKINNDGFKISAPPQLSITKINPSKYFVKVTNATGPFLLVFSELHNNKWKAAIEEQSPLQHLIVNLYANGWLVDQKGNYTIKVEFTPQLWLESGEKVSLTIYALVLLLLFILSIKHMRRKSL